MAMNESPTRPAPEAPGILTVLILLNIFAPLVLITGALVALSISKPAIAAYLFASGVVSCLSLWAIYALLRWVWEIRCHLLELVILATPRQEPATAGPVNPNSVSTITDEERLRRRQKLAELDASVFKENG